MSEMQCLSITECEQLSGGALCNDIFIAAGSAIGFDVGLGLGAVIGAAVGSMMGDAFCGNSSRTGTPTADTLMDAD